MPAKDSDWMVRALALAQQGIGLASPNPTVGCILEKNERPVGVGFHQYAARDHAEVVALRQAGALAQGATAYVTLEPCSHHGRTGPCTDALIAAQVARVVVATVDPNPQVAGSGIRKLRQHGIPVDVGLCQQEARRLNEAFAKHILTRLPFVTQKVASSLDGRIAPAASAPAQTSGVSAKGAPYRLTGDASWQEVHRMRHAADAILTGIGTVLADNPLLTDRSGLPRRRALLRVVLDSRLRLPLTSRLVETARNDVLVFTLDPGKQPAARERIAVLQSRGVRVEFVPAEPASARTGKQAAHVSLPAVFARLGQLELTSVLTEAGSHLNAALLQAGIPDRLALFLAPVLLGENAVPSFSDAAAPSSAGGGPGSVFHQLRFLRPHYQHFDNDCLFTGTLRDPWAEVPSDESLPAAREAGAAQAGKIVAGTPSEPKPERSRPQPRAERSTRARSRGTGTGTR